MTTKFEVSERTVAAQLTAADFIHLQDGPRQGDRLIAQAHTGKICIGLAPNVAPRVGAELIYEPTGIKTSEGARVYRLSVALLPVATLAPAGDDEGDGDGVAF